MTTATEHAHKKPERRAVAEQRYPIGVYTTILLGEYGFPTRRLEPPELERLAAVREGVKRFYSDHMPDTLPGAQIDDAFQAVFLAGAEYGARLALQQVFPLTRAGYPIHWIEASLKDGNMESLVWNLCLMAMGETPECIPADLRPKPLTPAKGGSSPV